MEEVAVALFALVALALVFGPLAAAVVTFLRIRSLRSDMEQLRARVSALERYTDGAPAPAASAPPAQAPSARPSSVAWPTRSTSQRWLPP